MATSTKMKKPAARPAHWLDGSQADTWHSTTPADVIEAYTQADGQEGWEVWSDHLEARRGRSPLSRLLPGGEEALLWAMPAPLVDGETAELVRQLGRAKSFKKRRQRRRWADVAANWLDDASIASPSPAHAYECLAWAYALPRLPNCVGENLWWKLLNHLATTAREACHADARRDPLVWQLLAGELPVALAYFVPEIRSCIDNALLGWSALAEGLNELVDIDGIPRTAVTPVLPALAASWTRARAIAERLGAEGWQEPSSRRYELALLSLARLADIDARLWRAAEFFDLEKPMRSLLRRLASGGVTRGTMLARKRLPSPALHSEDARLAVMRTTWLSKAPRLTISYGERTPQLELATAGELLCSGAWRLEVRFHGEVREVSAAWETVCWHSDKDVDFLEIEAPLGDGLRVQRQVLLARKDEVLLLADAVLADHPGRIDYQASLPVCTHVGFHGAEETREGQLVGDRASARVLPLGLSEWRDETRRGSLEVTSGGLTLRQSHEGRAAYAAIFVDLNGQRAKQDCTWRQLTVAEIRTAQPRDVAVGYRAQVGECNWLVYRSLGEATIRSLLGQQVKAEFLFARMKPRGGCVRLLETEPVE